MQGKLLYEGCMATRKSVISLTEQLKKVCRERNYVSLLDVGTGNGYIAGEIQKEIPHMICEGFDISEKCVKTAKQNYPATTFYKGDITKLWQNQQYDIIVANPPFSEGSDYRKGDPIKSMVVPRGRDRHYFYYFIFSQSSKKLSNKGVLYIVAPKGSKKYLRKMASLFNIPELCIWEKSSFQIFYL